MRWDIFCNVIDNHGDVGVCWRLARELAARGHLARLWIDDASALAWMAPGGHAGVQVGGWAEAADPGHVVIEAFGCNLPADFVDAMAARGSLWLNLEYLSAEPYVERSHGLRSPVREGVDKFFFYPGFTARTGGLLREQDLDARQRAFDRAAWLQSRGITDGGATFVSLFCYEPPALHELLKQLAAGPGKTRLLVTAGRAAAAVRANLPPLSTHLDIHWLPLLSQPDYDHLLWASDFNFVRGEDSLVRALWAGKPFAWQLYPQADGAHHAKLHAFLGWLQPGPALREFFRVWNGESPGTLPDFRLALRDGAAPAARERARALPELVASLERFAGERSRI